MDTQKLLLNGAVVMGSVYAWDCAVKLKMSGRKKSAVVVSW